MQKAELSLTWLSAPMATLIAHRERGGALVFHSDHQVVEALPLAVGWSGPCGDLTTDAVHAEGHVFVALSDVVGQDTVDANVTVGGSHLDHSGTPTHVLGKKQESGHSDAMRQSPAPKGLTWTSRKLCSLPWSDEKKAEDDGGKHSVGSYYMPGP